MHLIFYTNLFIPARFHAYTVGPIILIRPTHKSNVGLVQHELTHVKQFYRNPLFGIWYLVSQTARLKYEAEAYREQLKYYSTDKTDEFANLLVNNYKLNITYEQAVNALSQHEN